MASDDRLNMDTDSVNWRAVAAGAVVVAAVIAGASTLWQSNPVDTGGSTIDVTLQVQGPASSQQQLTVANNSSAFDVLNETHTVSYETGSYGYFITAIDGMQQNDTHSWIFLVNSDPPSVSADTYTVADGDNVTFRLMSNEASQDLFE